MNELTEIARTENSKKVYVLKPYEFVKGDWLQMIKDIMDDKETKKYFEVYYIKGCLTIKTYSFNNKQNPNEKIEDNGDINE